MTNAEKLRDISKLIGKSVNMMKVTMTKARAHADPHNARRE